MGKWDRPMAVPDADQGYLSKDLCLMPLGNLTGRLSLAINSCFPVYRTLQYEGMKGLG